MNRSYIAIWAYALTAGCICSPASAAMPARQVRADAISLLAMGQKLEASGQSASAMRIYQALESDPNSEIRSEARYRRAKILMLAGRKTEAAVLLRHVIDDHPRAAPPRLELAGLLYEMGDERSALRELRVLGTLDLPLNVARFVDRLGTSLQGTKPLSFQLELALAPDSNVNRATTSNNLGTVFGDFILDKDSQAKSGIGATVRGFVQRRLNLSRDVNLQAHASLDANLYRRKDFNDVSLEVAGGPEFQLGPVRISSQIGAGQQWYGMHSYQRNFRLSASAWLKVDSSSQLRADWAARWSNNHFNKLQSGNGLSAAARYERALSPRLTVSLGAGLDRFHARDDAYSTRSWTLGANVYRDIGRMTVDVGAEIGGLRADDRLAILPQAREDSLFRAHIGTVVRQVSVAGFSPTVRLVVERNRSSVEYYDYKRTRTEFGLSRAF